MQSFLILSLLGGCLNAFCLTPNWGMELVTLFEGEIIPGTSPILSTHITIN